MGKKNSQGLQGPRATLQAWSNIVSFPYLPAACSAGGHATQGRQGRLGSPPGGGLLDRTLGIETYRRDREGPPTAPEELWNPPAPQKHVSVVGPKCRLSTSVVTCHRTGRLQVAVTLAGAALQPKQSPKTLAAEGRPLPAP